MIKTALQVIPALFVVGSALAQAPDVVIVASSAGAISDCRFTDIQEKLTALNMFESVEIFDAFRGTPTLTELQGFDAVLTYSNLNYQNADLLGDVFADYVDSGGGIVAAAFSMTEDNDDLQIGGRWITGGYEVIQTRQGSRNTPAVLGQIVDPSHPSIQGVSTLGGSQAFRPVPSTGLAQGSVVARWDDGAILVAQGAMPNRIDVGMYPPSSDCFSTYWSSTGDGALLIANSLIATAGVGSVGTSYCMPNANVTGVPARINATGTIATAENNLTLSASSLPLFSFSYFLVSSEQSFVMNPAGSAGNLCLGGMVGRYVGPGQIQQANTAGNISLQIDLSATPQPLGFVSVQPGDTWNFQTWYRDVVNGVATSNFTDGFSITFL